MKKQIIAATMSAMFLVSAMANVIHADTLANNQNQSESAEISQNRTTTVLNDSELFVELEKDLRQSAKYMVINLYNNVFTEDYQLSYTDYQDAMYALKAGVKNERVIEKLNNTLKEKLTAYDDTFLNPYGSSGVQSFSLAIAILYLQEQGEDVTSYHGVNLLDKLEQTFLQEQEVNPYVYPYLTAVIKNTDKDFTEIKKKVTEDVLKCYVSNETGTGIDYWGVSVDNNGQVLTALAGEYKTNAKVKEKVDAALMWNDTQKDATGAIISWGEANASATAMALRAAAQFGDMETAKGYYMAMEQFQSATKEGAYTYAGEDSIFSSRDALTGLLAYRKSLKGESLFEVVYKQDNEWMYENDPTSQAEVEILLINPAPTAEPENTPVPTTTAEPENTPTPEPTQMPTAKPDATQISSDSDAAALQSNKPQTLATDNISEAPKTGDVSDAGRFVVLAVWAVAVLAAVKGGKKERYGKI